MRKTLLFLYLLSLGSIAAYGQTRLTQDPKLERQLHESGLIHQPLPLDIENSFETNGWKKEVLQSAPLTRSAGTEGWSHSGAGSMSFSTEKTVSGKGSIKLQFPTFTGKRATGSPSDPDYATYGNSSVTYHLDGANLEKYNRIVFSIYPDCDGARIVNMNLTFRNADTPAKKGYNQPSGSHLINLINKEWNQCFLEIDEYQRDKVMSITFSTALKGKDRTTGDSAIYYLDNLQLQTVKAPEKVSGWIPADGKISYSTTGYAVNHPKTALINTNLTIDAGKRFQLLTPTGEIAYEGDIRKEKTTLGEFGLIDFTSFNNPGEYQLKVGTSLTPTFRIGERLWEDSQWKVLNFIFCQRCGHPVPGKHSTCHVDLMSRHDGRSISYSGGWHDAGDLSQQTLQTGDVTFALLEAYNKQRNINPALAARLREEAEWGVEFILKNRYGDGYRASSMGLLIWQDGVFNTLDDISSVRVQNMAFDNFLYAGYEAYASMTLDNDPMLQEYLLRVAEEDFAFAMEKFKKDGFDQFVQPYEHSYNTSKSQYMATISWSASQLYKLTGKPSYADIAAEYIRYTLDCQRTEPLKDKDGTRGFFYRDKSRKSIVHYIHQSREQVYMQAMVMLCETQKEHPDYPKWVNSIQLYGDYLKGYNTSKSQYMATISWSASQLYKLTGKPSYADIAAEYIRYTLDCQRTEPLKDKDGTRGFFYRDKSRKSIVHYIHQSREQVYMQAMVMLCETQKEHPDYPKWVNSIQLYGDYLKGMMKYTHPYGMIPSGVYHAEEYKDTTNFYALHLFPPANAKELYTEQIKRGVQLDKEHYMKRFPVWFNIFNGNTAIHLSNGKSAAICGNFLKDKELLNIGLEQLYWTVGKNPFGQSLIYGEGHNYPQLNTFSSGEMTGEMPVGIRTLGNDDVPYWPQTNNACYKEVWITSAGKWLSLIAEY